VVKHVDEVELRVVVAAVLAVAPGAVLVAQHLLNRGAHMVTIPARQYMNNLARRSSLKAGSKREKGEKGGHSGKEWINVRKSLWRFGTGNRKCRSCARVYPGWENKVVLTIQLLELLAPYRGRRAWAPFKAPLKPGDCLPFVAQNLVPEKSAGKKAAVEKGEKNRRRLLFHRHRPQGAGGKGGGGGGVECAQRWGPLAGSSRLLVCAFYFEPCRPLPRPRPLPPPLPPPAA
jgi:hypothetical protein